MMKVKVILGRDNRLWRRLRYAELEAAIASGDRDALVGVIPNFADLVEFVRHTFFNAVGESKENGADAGDFFYLQYEDGEGDMITMAMGCDLVDAIIGTVEDGMRSLKVCVRRGSIEQASAAAFEEEDDDDEEEEDRDHMLSLPLVAPITADAKKAEVGIESIGIEPMVDKKKKKKKKRKSKQVTEELAALGIDCESIGGSDVLKTDVANFDLDMILKAVGHEYEVIPTGDGTPVGIASPIQLLPPIPMASAKPDSWTLMSPPLESRVVHASIRCDVCKRLPIVGVRYKCSCCLRFDLCEDCEAELRAQVSAGLLPASMLHPAFHPLIQLKLPLEESASRVFESECIDLLTAQQSTAVDIGTLAQLNGAVDLDQNWRSIVYYLGCQQQVGTGVGFAAGSGGFDMPVSYGVDARIAPEMCGGGAAMYYGAPTHLYPEAAYNTAAMAPSTVAYKADTTMKPQSFVKKKEVPLVEAIVDTELNDESLLEETKDTVQMTKGTELQNVMLAAASGEKLGAAAALKPVAKACERFKREPEYDFHRSFDRCFGPDFMKARRGGFGGGGQRGGFGGGQRGGYGRPFEWEHRGGGRGGGHRGGFGGHMRDRDWRKGRRGDGGPLRRGPPAEARAGAEFIENLTIADRSKQLCGALLTKVWTLRNNGSHEWGATVKVAFLKGHSELCADGALSFTVPNAKPTQTVEVSIGIRVPQKEGRYCAYFRLQRHGSEWFGPRLWVDVFAVKSLTEEEKEG